MYYGTEYDEVHDLPNRNGYKHCWLGIKYEGPYSFETHTYHYDNKDGWYNIERVFMNTVPFDYIEVKKEKTVEDQDGTKVTKTDKKELEVPSK